jgi:hypothetical protein
MQLVSRQQIGKHAYKYTVIIGGDVMRKKIGGDPVQLRVEKSGYGETS